MSGGIASRAEVNNLREIQALRRLSGHPNIIKLYEASALPPRRGGVGD